MKNRDLETVEAVVEVIGRKQLYEIADCASNNVTNWCSAGRFPATTYLIIQAELKRLGYRAGASLWGIREPRKARAAA